MNSPGIMIVDDAKTSLMLTEKMLLRKWPESKITTEDLPFAGILTMEIERPDILIIDYEFPNYNIVDEGSIIRRLIHFDGIVIIYSGHEIRDIKSCFLKKFGHLPKNFRIINKRNPMGIIDEIIRYKSKKDNGIKYPANID